MSDLFSRPKVGEACLSAWQISQLDLGLLAADARRAGEAHLEQCASCAARMREERAARQAAVLEPVPPGLTDMAPHGPRRLAWWFAGGAGALAAGAAALVMQIGAAPDVRAKGELPVSLSVERAGRLIVDNEPAERVRGLVPGDRLLVRGQAQGYWVVEVWSEGAWREAFAGDAPPDGWLPIGLTVTGDGATRLRLTACEAKARARCDARELAF